VLQCVLLCVAVCCSVLQFVAVCCSVYVECCSEVDFVHSITLDLVNSAPKPSHPSENRVVFGKPIVVSGSCNVNPIYAGQGESLRSWTLLQHTATHCNTLQHTGNVVYQLNSLMWCKCLCKSGWFEKNASHHT